MVRAEFAAMEANANIIDTSKEFSIVCVSEFVVYFLFVRDF